MMWIMSVIEDSTNQPAWSGEACAGSLQLTTTALDLCALFVQRHL